MYTNIYNYIANSKPIRYISSGRGLSLEVKRSEYLEPDIGGKAGNFMKKREYNYEMPRGEVRRVADFLPPPYQLAFPEDTVKITIALKQSSVDLKVRRHATEVSVEILERRGQIQVSVVFGRTADPADT